MRRARAFLLALFLLIIPFGYALQAKAQVVDWDPRLSDIGVVLEPAIDCSGGCWRIIKAYYLDESESGGLHHSFIKMLDENGNQLAGMPWHVTYPDGNIRILSKAAPDWADFALYDCFNTETEHGAYSAYAGDESARSDWLENMGLPFCHHVSYGIIWQWQPVSCTACQPRAYLPMARK